jgi:hypothetical protein
VDTFNSPFVQLRWSATGLGKARPFFEWITETKTNFASDWRIYFDPVDGPTVHYTMIPAYRHPQWTNLITGMRLNFDNAQASGTVTIQAFFAQYDTRHNINSQNFVRGCANYFWWTHDLEFLRGNINRIRTGLRYVMTEHHALEKKVVFTDRIGHDGRAGYRRNPDGSKTHAFGHGVGNNYWDILPFGNLDCYATIHYYDALQTMIRLEREIRAHPDWQMPLGSAAFDPDTLVRHAEEVKAEGNRLFWNEKTGRFVACIDADGQSHDYGFTFLNNEAVCYGFASPARTESIMSWMDGQRMVDGDTAQGKDIYHWRFGPRATTKRNLDWYFWAWDSPESFPFGGQVQDGGAVLGFSYHDLMARLNALGPDNAWQRLQEVLRWYDDVALSGDYRKYYDGKREGTLQGGGTAGGLGLDMEFFESAMVPQVMLYGFLGFAPRGEGFKIEPRLPTDWSELAIDRIRFQDLTLRIRVARRQIEIHKTGTRREPMFVELPGGQWLASFSAEDGSRVTSGKVRAHPAYGTEELEWGDAATVRFVRAE